MIYNDKLQWIFQLTLLNNKSTEKKTLFDITAIILLVTIVLESDVRFRQIVLLFLLK